jgi:hypothetical protein
MKGSIVSPRGSRQWRTKRLNMNIVLAFSAPPKRSHSASASVPKR